MAFDFCPIVNAKAAWNNVKLFEDIGKIGEALGLEWGGGWKKIIDRPHFQYLAGYAISDFKNNKVGWKKFD